MNYEINPPPIEGDSVSRADRRATGRTVRKAQLAMPAVWKAIHSPVAHMGNKQIGKLLKKTSDNHLFDFYQKSKAILQEVEVALKSGNLEQSENQKRLAKQVEIAGEELKSRGVEMLIPSGGNALP